MANNTIQTNNSNRGFAGMDSDRQRSIASMGGMSQGKGNNPGNFANNPERARAAGKRGGMSRGENSRKKADQNNSSENDTENPTDAA